MYYQGGVHPKPETNKENLRVYGHMLWPFVQRSFLALGAKQIPFQVCHVDLNEKAEWHLAVNGGLVPILETTEGEMVQESAVIASFASDVALKGQGIPLWPHEAAEPGDVNAAMKTAKTKI